MENKILYQQPVEVPTTSMCMIKKRDLDKKETNT